MLQAGFNAGDGVKSEVVSGSRTEAMINIASTSNVNIPGVWIFRVDGPDIQSATCVDNTNSGETKITDVYVS